jgi:Ino eighty subunit 2
MTDEGVLTVSCQMSTINRLLKRQPPKRKGKAINPEAGEAGTAAEGASPAEVEEIEVERANPLFVRWVNNKDGSRVGVPNEWLGKKVGRIFGPAHPSRGELVEETA